MRPPFAVRRAGARRLARLRTISALVMSLLADVMTTNLAYADLIPPKVQRTVEAIDPRPADVPAARVTVELELDLDAVGSVTAARVIRSSNDAAVDEAAMSAARSMSFVPAARDGKSVASRIRYEYVFEARDPRPKEEPRASLSLVVRDRANDKPLSGADVVVTNDQGSVLHRGRTDATGAIRVAGAAPGAVHVTVTAEGRRSMRLDETLEAGILTEATLRLDEAEDPEAFTATARVDAPPREVTRRTLVNEEMAHVAGTRGDPLRAVELLPGVGRPAANGGLPILRGANPFDTQVFLEGAPVGNLYHIGGLTSFVHSRVLESVDLYPSSFSVRYGRKVGGVIEARLRDPRTDGPHGIAEASFLDSSLLVETPIGEHVSALAAVRRSNLDAVINGASTFGDTGITAAPIYWDYQGIVAWKPTDADRLRLLGYGTSDRLGIVLANPAEVDPAVRGTFEVSAVYHRVQLGYRHRFRGGSEQNTELTYGYATEHGVFGDIGRFEFVTHMAQGRSEWTMVANKHVRVIAGIDALSSHIDGVYLGVPPTPGEGENPTSLSSERRVSVDTGVWQNLPGAYAELGLRPISALLISPGVRADYDSFIDEAAADPRLSSRLDASDKTAIKAGVGRFSQSPDIPHVVRPIGNPDLGMTHAVHASAGVEHRPWSSLTVSVEGFGKWIDDVVTATPNGRAPFFINGQKGRVFGGELLVRVKPMGRFFGFLSYTLMRSERRDDGQPWRLFDRDQTHILGASAVVRLGRGWEVGATVRYTSGTPYTPVTSATYDAMTDVYSPRLGRNMSARNPAFSRLDLRVQKTWHIGSRFMLSAYLDVQNALNSPNREGVEYSYDYRRRQGVSGLPILPILGLRGEL